MLQELGFANAKSYREFVESAQHFAKLHDRRRSSVVQTINISKQLFSGFLREKRVEEGFIEEDDYSSSSTDDGNSLLEDSASTINTSKKSKYVDENNILIDLRAPHLAQQQQRPSQNGYGQNLEMTLTPLYDVDLYLHFDKKKRKIRRRLYPYLTRLQNSRNEREYIRVRPILHNAGYANNSLWSKRSIQLEQTLRSYLKQNGISNNGSSTSLVSGSSSSSSANMVQYILENVSLYNKIPVGCNVSFVDTFWSDEECNPNLELIHRLTASDGTAITQERSLHKETYRQLEFDLLLLNMVNDYMSLYKQIHSPTGFEQFLIENNILHDNAHLIKVLKKKNEVAEIFNEIYEQHFASNKDEKIQDNPEVSGDGNYKCEGMLIGVAASNDVHIRPLCTSADMSLAINELQDPRVFKYGYIAMPHMLQMNLERITDGFYRFDYHAKDGFSIKYMRITLPTADKDLKPFMGMASYTLTSECYEEELLYTTVTDQLNRKGTSPKRKGGTTKISKAVRDGNLVPPALLEFCNHLIRTLNDIYRIYTKVILSTIFDIEALMVLKDYQKSNILGPPHRALRNADAEQIQYRVLSMHHVEVRECLTHFRRKAICSIDGIQRNYLKEFYVEFKKEWNTIINQSHTIENIEDFYSLSAAQRSAIKYAHKVYNRLKESEGPESDVFELDQDDIEREFLKELKYEETPAMAREKDHALSKALIEQYRPSEKPIVVPNGEEIPNPVESATGPILSVANEEIVPAPIPAVPARRSGSATSSYIGNRRQSKMDRKQSTVRSLKKKKPLVNSRLKPNESDSDLSVGPLEEPDPFEKEKEIAGLQYAEGFVQMIQSADQSAVSTLQQRGPRRMVPYEHVESKKFGDSSISYIDPYNTKLKILCDNNLSKHYHQSFPASKELLCREEVFPKPFEFSPWKNKSKRTVQKVQLLKEAQEDKDRLHMSSSDEEERDDGYRLGNPFPYVEKLNREAYRLAEKLDVLTVMMLGLDSKTIDRTKEKAKEKAKSTMKNAANKKALSLSSSVQHSPQQTPVLALTPNGTVKQHFTFDSIQPTSSNDLTSPKGLNSHQHHFGSGDLNSLPSGEDSDAPDDFQKTKSPLRAYLRRFSQRFKGILQDDIIYSDTDSDKDPRDEDSDNSEPRVLGLTQEGKKAEENKILEIILTSIDPKVSERIRKGLALREERLRLMRRQQYIRRRRRQEDLTEEDVKQLKEYFDSLPPNDHPFSSSSSEEDEVSLTSAGVDYKMEAIPINVTFKRMRGNTIRKTTPTPLYLHLEHRSTNVTIDPSFYERLSSRQSTVGSSGSTTPFPSRPNTTRHSMLIGNVTFDGMGLPKDKSKANIWEQMTDTLSSMCDDVDDEAANFQHFQHQSRQRRMGVTMFVNRTGGKLWGDNLGSTMIVSRKENPNETILEGSTSTSAGTVSISDGSHSHKTAPTSSAVLLQVSHFATEYCYELFAVALASVSDRVLARKQGESTAPKKFSDRRISTIHPRQSLRASSPRLSMITPSAPMAEFRRSTLIENLTRKTKFNLIDEFNKIFDEPLRPPSQSSNQKQFQQGSRASKRIRFDDELEEGQENEDEADNEDDDNDSKDLLGKVLENNNSSAAIRNDELDDLLLMMKSNQGQKLDPLLGSLPTTAGSKNRPYSCGMLGTDSSIEAVRDKLDAAHKYLPFLKPKSSHASRMEYDEQTRHQWKQKSPRLPSKPNVHSNQHKSLSERPARDVKFGVKGLKALVDPASSPKQAKDGGGCHNRFREEVPESDEDFETRQPSLSLAEWNADRDDHHDSPKNKSMIHVPISWSLEGHAMLANRNQTDSTVQEESKPQPSLSVTKGESLDSQSIQCVGDLKLANMLAINPPTDSVISFPSITQLENKAQIIFKDDIDDIVLDGGQDESGDRSTSSLALAYPNMTEVKFKDMPLFSDGDRILVAKSTSFDKYEDDSGINANESAKQDRYIASSIISSIYNAQSYYQQASHQIQMIRSPSPPNKSGHHTTITSPPLSSFRPSTFSPNQRMRMLKPAQSSSKNMNNSSTISNKGNNVDMDGVLKTTRPVTTSARFRQSDYMK